MSKKLAIRGHSARGKEVIELLEMMGGKNIHKHDGGSNSYSYYLFDHAILHDRLSIAEDDDFEIFTLEKFLEKYPFKVGDKVIDVSDGCPGVVSEMKWDAHVSDMKYFVVFGDGIDFGWFPTGSIEFCKENKNLEDTQSKRDIDLSEFVIKHMILPNKMDDKLEYEIIDGYEFDKVENNKIILKPIKPKYPKLTNLTECKEILGEKDIYQSVSGYKGELLTNFQLLLIFRDVYWKIAGEQMGLDKPWEPDWNDHNQPKFGIHTVQNNIRPITLHVLKNLILIFPTEEMRDAFYKNFEDLIERCKVLL